MYAVLFADGREIGKRVRITRGIPIYFSPSPEELSTGHYPDLSIRVFNSESDKHYIFSICPTIGEAKNEHHVSGFQSYSFTFNGLKKV